MTFVSETVNKAPLALFTVNVSVDELFASITLDRDPKVVMVNVSLLDPAPDMVGVFAVDKSIASILVAAPPVSTIFPLDVPPEYKPVLESFRNVADGAVNDPIGNVIGLADCVVVLLHISFDAPPMTTFSWLAFGRLIPVVGSSSKEYTGSDELPVSLRRIRFGSIVAPSTIPSP